MSTFHVIRYQPEIPPNTGNIVRLCANTGSVLHLVRPLGFSLDDRRLARAGLDYREFAEVLVHDRWDDCAQTLQGRRLFAVSTRGETRFDRPAYLKGDAFLFGAETRGLPEVLLRSVDTGQRVRIPMAARGRSLNLANAAAVVLYEAWRQLGFVTSQ